MGSLCVDRLTRTSAANGEAKSEYKPHTMGPGWEAKATFFCSPVKPWAHCTRSPLAHYRLLTAVLIS